MTTESANHIQNEDIDPFSHKIQMSNLRWIRTVLLTPILVPIRLILIALTLLLSWLVLFVTLFGLNEDVVMSQPLIGWRKTSKNIFSKLGQLCFR